MSFRIDPLPQLAARRASSPALVRLFEELAQRAEELAQRATVFARMQREVTEAIRQHRAAREGKPVRLSSGQKRALKEFDRDSEQAAQELEHLVASLDDAALLAAVWSGVSQGVKSDERMLPAYHADDRPMAMQLLEFQRETVRRIEQFVEASPFKGRVVPRSY